MLGISFAGGMVSGSLAPALYGGDFGDIAGGGISGGFKGGAMGAAIGGIMGGIDAASNGRDFWSGGVKGVGGDALARQKVLVYNPETNGETYVNPTGGEIRQPDGGGEGWYGARRGSRHHLGLDINSTPGQEVVSPVDGKVIIFKSTSQKTNIHKYTANIYPSNSKAGVSNVQLLYLNKPTYGLGKTIPIKAGERLFSTAGRLTDFGYSASVTNHVHVQVYQSGLKVNPSPFFFPKIKFPIYPIYYSGWTKKN